MKWAPAAAVGGLALATLVGAALLSQPAKSAPPPRRRRPADRAPVPDPGGWTALEPGPGLAVRRWTLRRGANHVTATVGRRVAAAVDQLLVDAPGRRLVVGDGSLLGGGPLPPHRSHRLGIDLDLSPVLDRYGSPGDSLHPLVAAALVTLAPAEIWYREEIPGPWISHVDPGHSTHLHLRW